MIMRGSDIFSFHTKRFIRGGRHGDAKHLQLTVSEICHAQKLPVCIHQDDYGLTNAAPVGMIKTLYLMIFTVSADVQFCPSTVRSLQISI